MTGNFGPLNMSYADQKFFHCISMGIKQPSAQVQTSNKVLNVTENKNAQILSVLTNFLFKSKIIHVCLFFFLNVLFFKKITVWQTLLIGFPICLIS